MSLRASAALVLAVCVASVAALPQPRLTADDIARRVRDRDTGRDSRSEMRMRLFDRHGRVRERVLTLPVLRGRDDPGAPKTAPDGDRLLIRFSYPNDIRGTGFLVWEHPKVEDERFLYLPSLGRVHRIAGEETQESFVGSDLTCEDIGGREFEDYTYATLNENASWNGRPAWQLSAIILLGALAFVPHVDITHIDNDITAWFSKEDPVFKDYERFRSEFGGTRTLMVALKGDTPERMFSRETLAFIDRVTGDIERVPTVQRVDSLATATILEAPGTDTLDLTPLLESGGGGDPAQVRRRALQDDLIRGDLVSDDGTVTAIVVSFVEDSFQSPSLQIVSGHSVDAGAGVDRKAGEYRVSGTVLVHRESYSTAISSGPASTSTDTGRTDVSLVLSVDRTFARERYRARAFGVYNTTESSAFLRGIATATLRDNVALEGSAGWFIGEGRDLIGRFSDSDFAYLKLRYYF